MKEELYKVKFEVAELIMIYDDNLLNIFIKYISQKGLEV